MTTVKAYRCGLPKPDDLGRWRPVVGRAKNGKPQRFQVGNKRDTSESEAMRRLDAIRDLWDLQCKRDGIDYWNDWALKWAVRMATEVPVRVQASGYAQRNVGQAAEELSAMYTLQAWGLPIQVTDPALLAGHGEIRACIQNEVAQAVEQAMKQLSQSWGQGTMEKVQTELPQNWA